MSYLPVYHIRKKRVMKKEGGTQGDGGKGSCCVFLLLSMEKLEPELQEPLGI